MPFTPTHITAIVPLVYLAPRLPVSALVIGAMIPDLPLFLPWGVSYDLTHSVPGLFLACLPLGLGAFYLFQRLLKRPLLALLPGGIQGRLMPWGAPLLAPSLVLGLQVAVAVLLGAGSHVLWDAFTHEGRLGMALFPSLGEPGALGLPWPGYKLLQVGSTLVLLPSLLIFLGFWLRAQAPSPTLGLPALSPSRRWVSLLALLGLPILLGVLMALLQGETAYEILGIAIRRTGGLMGLAFLGYGSVMTLRREQGS